MFMIAERKIFFFLVTWVTQGPDTIGQLVNWSLSVSVVHEHILKITILNQFLPNMILYDLFCHM